jgi:peptide/nickel transport system permease protein
MTIDDVVASAHLGDEGGEEPPEAVKRIEGRGPWRLAYERLRRDRAAMISAIVIIIIVLVAIFAPVFAWITGHGVLTQYSTTGLSPDGLPHAPSTHFLLGTDDLGRDLLVRIAYGARISLLVGVVATFITVFIGVIVGMAAGYLGTVVDTILARLIDVVLSIPFLLFALSLASVTHAGLTIVIVVLSAFGWASVARIVRGQVLTVREREYVEAAKSLGAGSALAPIIVYTTLLIPVSIVGEATLSFLGVGVQPPTADWGAMISTASGGDLYEHAWWYLVFPSLALLATTLAFNIFGDGVRDAFDPRADRLMR